MFGAIVLAEPGSMDAPARIDALRAVLASRSFVPAQAPAGHGDRP